MVGDDGINGGGGAFVVAYLAAAAAGEIGGHEEEWYTPDAYEVVWPHPLLPQGRMSDLRTMKEDEGRTHVTAQEYEIANVVEGGDVVLVEAAHRLELQESQGSKVRTVRMNVAFVFTLRLGRISRLHVYRCQHR